MHCLEALQTTKFTPTTPQRTVYVFQIKKNVHVGCKNTLHVLKRHARRQGGQTNAGHTQSWKEEGRKMRNKGREKHEKKERRKPVYSFYFLIYYGESTAIVRKANKYKQERDIEASISIGAPRWCISLFISCRRNAVLVWRTKFCWRSLQTRLYGSLKALKTAFRETYPEIIIIIIISIFLFTFM